MNWATPCLHSGVILRWRRVVEPNRGEKFLLAMDMKSARDLGYMLLRTVMRVAPGVLLEEALNGPQGQLLREKLSNGGLSYEELLAAVQ